MLHTFRAGVFCQISVFALCRRALGGSLGAFRRGALRRPFHRGSLISNGAGGGRIACGCKDGIVDLALSQRGGLRSRGCTVYVSFQETLFPKGLGNCGKTLWRTTFTADAYGQIWKGGVLAADLYAVFNSDGTPWPMLARMGGGQRMRGYYQGRYTDNDMITVQVELRQRIWRRIGCAVWGGAGNVFPSLSRFDWSQTLPNYGAGLRWELKKRVNVRLDYGFGKKTSGFLLNINEAF